MKMNLKFEGVKIAGEVAVDHVEFDYEITPEEALSLIKSYPEVVGKLVEALGKLRAVAKQK